MTNREMLEDRELPSLAAVLRSISEKDPLQRKSLARYIDSCSYDFLRLANGYVRKFIKFLESMEYDVGFAADAYLTMVRDILIEQTRFLRDGRYRYSNLDEVYQTIYSDKDYMFKYMIGVALSQFFWRNHRDMFLFFRKHISQIKGEKYLEIGPGHGLFFVEALGSQNFDNYFAIDISATALNMTRDFIEFYMGGTPNNVRYILGDVCQHELEDRYSFITMGEVLEHVENPTDLLHSVWHSLNAGGNAYLSTCANCPVVDHIHLYRTIDEIRKDIRSAQFKIVGEIVISIDNLPPEVWQAKKANLSYACLVSK